MTRLIFIALFAMVLPSSATSLEGASPRVAEDAAFVVVRIHHVVTYAGFTCAAFATGETCRDLSHWSIAIGSREFTGSPFSKALDELERVARRDDGAAPGHASLASIAIVLCVHKKAPFGLAQLLIDRCHEIGAWRIVTVDGDEPPTRIDELRVSLPFDPRTMKSSRRLGTREVKSDEELGVLVEEARESDEREGHTLTLVTIDVQGESDWDFAQNAAEACRRAGVRSVELTMMRPERKLPPSPDAKTSVVTVPPAARKADLKHVDPATAGTLAGTVWFDGTAPPRIPIDLSGNPDCARQHTEPVYMDDLIVADGKVANAFLELEVPDGYEPPSEAAVLDQKGCLFVPQVMGIQTGQEFRVRNSDGFLHNVHTLLRSTLPDASPDASFEENIFAMTRSGMRTLAFGADEGVVRIKCDIHPWMHAWVTIVKHPFFAVSAADGTYTIKNVPPGEYDLVMHHEKQTPDQRARVKISTGATTTQDFTLKH